MVVVMMVVIMMMVMIFALTFHVALYVSLCRIKPSRVIWHGGSSGVPLRGIRGPCGNDHVCIHRHISYLAAGQEPTHSASFPRDLRHLFLLKEELH